MAMRAPPRAGGPVHCTGCTGDSYGPVRKASAELDVKRSLK